MIDIDDRSMACMHFVANTLSRHRPLTIAVGKCLATLRTARRICQAGETKKAVIRGSQVHVHD